MPSHGSLQDFSMLSGKFSCENAFPFKSTTISSLCIQKILGHFLHKPHMYNLSIKLGSAQWFHLFISERSRCTFYTLGRSFIESQSKTNQYRCGSGADKFIGGLLNNDCCSTSNRVGVSLLRLIAILGKGYSNGRCH